MKRWALVNLFLGALIWETAVANSRANCSHAAQYSDRETHCVDITPSDTIILGYITVVSTGPLESRRVYIHDQKYGDLELLLTAPLAQAIDEAPAESYEVEGAIKGGQVLVKSLRPIE